MIVTQNKKVLFLFITLFYIGFSACSNFKSGSKKPLIDGTVPDKSITIPTLDISQDTSRQVVIAPGTKDIRQGHPNSVLMADKMVLMIARENNREYNSWIMTSDNEGKTWSEPRQVSAAVTMHRHQAEYAPDGRLVIVGRDVAENSPAKGHFTAWVGEYEDLLKGSEDQYRIKLLHSYKSTEYPGLVVLSDGTFVACNSVVYRQGENYSVISTRFNLDELDKLYKNEYARR